MAFVALRFNIVAMFCAASSVLIPLGGWLSLLFTTRGLPSDQGYEGFKNLFVVLAISFTLSAAGALAGGFAIARSEPQPWLTSAAVLLSLLVCLPLGALMLLIWQATS